MRAHKYKAWHKEYKTWVPWEVLKDLFEGKKIIVTDHVIRQVDDFTGEVEINTTPWSHYKMHQNINIFEHPDFEIVEYTGLKDKNGKEVYEGDILHLQRDGFDSDPWNNLKTEVTFENGMYMVAKRTLYQASTLYKYKFEIIGNIYENKNS